MENARASRTRVDVRQIVRELLDDIRGHLALIEKDCIVARSRSTEETSVAHQVLQAKPPVSSVQACISEEKDSRSRCRRGGQCRDRRRCRLARCRIGRRHPE